MRTVIWLVVLAGYAGLIPAFIARHKGWPFVVWWVYGALLFVTALPHSLILKRNPDKARALRK